LPELDGYWQVLIDTAEETSENIHKVDKNTLKNISHPALTIAEHSCVVLRYLHSSKN
jgi:hypothetical protein